MTADFVAPPALWLLAGVIIVPFLFRRWRSWAFMIFPLGALVYIWQIPDGSMLQVTMLQIQLVLSGQVLLMLIMIPLNMN